MLQSNYRLDGNKLPAMGPVGSCYSQRKEEIESPRRELSIQN